MAIFGGSSSKTTNTTNTTTYNAAADGDNEGTIVSGSGNNVTVTDHDAVAGALKLGSDAIDGIGEAQDDALEFGDTVFNRASSDYNSTLSNLISSQNAQSAANERMINSLQDFASNQMTGGAQDAIQNFTKLVIGLAIVVGVSAIVIAIWRK